MSEQTPRILVLCPDWTQPSGGVRKMYRHVDVLNAHGIPALLVHDKPDFRCTWFENQTLVTSRPQVWPPARSDILLVPELIAFQSMHLAPGIRKVIFNQGAYQTFLQVTPEIQQLAAPYCHPDFLATIVVSEDSRQYLQFVFPNHLVFRIYNSVNPALFRYEPAKRPQIAFMMNRKKADVTQVVRILRFRRSLAGFETAAIVDKTESETAQILRESQVFLSFCSSEGAPMPPLEAMACGCITVGYHGRGGMEYLNDEYAFPVEAEDVIGFARKVEQILAQLRTDPHPLTEKARRAAEFVHESYSPRREESSIVQAWEQILGTPTHGSG